MALLTIEGVEKTYGEKHLLRQVALVVNEGERIGLVGPNGCGKSTLLGILAGAIEMDDGKRTTKRDLRIGYLEQEPVVDPEQTVRQAVRAGLGERDAVERELGEVHEALADPELDDGKMNALLARQAKLDDRLDGLGGHDIEHAIEAVIHDVGLQDPDVVCGPMSGGERRRVALARLLLQQPDLLLLDEPTNHLDATVTQWLQQRLASLRGGLVMVTHDRYFLDSVVDRIIEVDTGVLYDYSGNYSTFLAQRADRLEREGKAEASRLNLLRREAAWMKRGPPARTTKAKARISRFEDLADSAPEAKGADLEFRIPPGPRLGDRVIELKGVHKAYGDKVVLDGLELEIGPGTRLGIVGPNGAGKTTFLKLCMGLLEPDAGSVTVGPTVQFASIDQGRTDLDPDRTVLDEVGRDNDWVKVGERSMRIETFLDQFLFPGKTKMSRVGDLSGGERNRVLLAKLLSAGGNLLVLDEPTNDLDLMSLRTLEEALIDFPGGVLVVSHDRWFLDRVATRILYLDHGGVSRVHEGDLSMLLDKLHAERAASEKAASARAKMAAAAAASASSPVAPKKPKLSTREARELEALPEKISTAEAEMETLDRELGDPTLYETQAGKERITALSNRRPELQAEIDGLYERWEELEAKREGTSG